MPKTVVASRGVLGRAAFRVVSSLFGEAMKRCAANPVSVRPHIACEPLENRTMLTGVFENIISFNSCTAGITPSVFCTCPPQVIQESSQANGNEASTKWNGMTVAPIRYVDGQPDITATDLTSAGLGQAWNQARSFDISLTTGPMGNHWLDTDTPFLFQEGAFTGDTNRPAGDTTIVAYSDAMDQRFFVTVQTLTGSSEGIGWPARHATKACSK